MGSQALRYIINPTSSRWYVYVCLCTALVSSQQVFITCYVTQQESQQNTYTPVNRAHIANKVLLCITVCLPILYIYMWRAQVHIRWNVTQNEQSLSACGMQLNEHLEHFFCTLYIPLSMSKVSDHREMQMYSGWKKLLRSLFCTYNSLDFSGMSSTVLPVNDCVQTMRLSVLSSVNLL